MAIIRIREKVDRYAANAYAAAQGNRLHVYAAIDRLMARTHEELNIMGNGSRRLEILEAYDIVHRDLFETFEELEYYIEQNHQGLLKTWWLGNNLSRLNRQAARLKEIYPQLFDDSNQETST